MRWARTSRFTQPDIGFALSVRHLGTAVGLAVISAGASFAQGTGTVASPIVKPGASFSFASAIALDEGETGFANRLAYRRGIGDKLRVSAIVFYNDRGGSYRYRRLALETMYQFAASDTGWNSALQLRGFFPDGNDGAERFRIAWLNRWRPEKGPEVRVIGLASREFGKTRDLGIALETRGELTWRSGTDTRLGLQIFNRYNTTESFGTFNSQRHAVGGVIKGGLTDTMSYRINALAGISDAAADFELRMRLRYSF